MAEGVIEVGGIRSPLLQAGPADAEEAVVFVHGNPGSSRDWASLVEGAGRLGRAVAPDMPGFGRAGKSADFDYTVEGYARHLGRMLDQLGIRRAHLVLHDFGGPWGLAWAAQNPDRFASAVLINTGVLREYHWHYMALIWRTPILGELSMALSTRRGFHMLLKHGNPRGLPPAFVDRMFDEFDAGTRRAVLKLYRATVPRGGADALVGALRPLRRPALVVWGARDPYIPAIYAERQREIFPDADVQILDQSGHFPFADDPARVAELVLPFLEKTLTKHPNADPAGARA